MKIRAMQKADLPLVKAFTDRTIGTNYYSVPELEGILQRSLSQGVVCSLLLEDETGEIRGVRITYPPGNWQHGKGKGLNPAQWRVPLTDVAYFQSLFVDPTLTGQGWGKRLSEASLELLKNLGAKAVVLHSWMESPNDSSGRYARAIGFERVALHPLYWKEVDYVCTRCGKPCLCTAEEMIRYL